MSQTPVPPGGTDDGRSVAVIGMACRFAGATNPTELWSVLRDQVDATSQTPAERYDVAALHTTTGERGKVGTRRAGYLAGMADFDAGFFGMSPAEATDLDPQHRHLLMATWEALEDAGQRPDLLAGSRTGVYVGNTRGDFGEQQFRRGLASITPDAYHSFRPLQPARLSHFFDWRGPSVTVDTACSSSLSAVHLAVQSLRAGESPLAIAAGVNIALRADETVMMTQAGTLSADGRSRFGDADADGFAPSDGVGVLVLKPLAAALADGDRVRAVIKGSAIGNDGHSSDSLLTPSLDGQIDILRWAYRDAGVSPAEVEFVEAHGSGSPTLDAAELNAIATVLGADRPADRPCYVGSVKTNIGHTEAAGGIAGVIKTVLCLEHGELPASLHHHTPSPMVDWHRSIRVPTESCDLPDRGRPTLAGVSGQGGSALNAHVVLARAAGRPSAATAPPVPNTQGYQLLLSAATPQAVADLARRYIDYLGPYGPGSHHDVGDICFSAAARRQQHEHRLAVTGTTHQDLIAALTRYLTDPEVVEDAEITESVPEQFGPDCRYVALPTYPWQTERHWPGDRRAIREGDRGEESDLAEELIRLHARSGAEADDNTLLAEIGIDSLARLEITAGLAEDYGYHADIEELARLRTVGDLRGWVEALRTDRTPSPVR